MRGFIKRHTGLLIGLAAALTVGLPVALEAASVTNYYAVGNWVYGLYSGSTPGQLYIYKSGSAHVTVDGSGITATRTITLPNSDVTLVGSTGTPTYGGLTLTAAPTSATASANAAAATLTQTTNARTAGTADGYKITMTGLAGDTSGATYNGLESLVTTNGGSGVYNALKIGDGWTNAINSSSASTGKNRWLLPASVADAFTWTDGTNGYLTVNSSTPAVGVTQRLTTTDGVNSGAALVVGGRASSNTAAGSSLTNSNAETVLCSYSIPANQLKSGSVLRFRNKVKVTADNGATTLTPRVRLGSTTLTGTVLASGNPQDTSTNDVWISEGEIVSRAAPGASVAIEGYGSKLGNAAAPGAAMVSWSLDATNFATDAALLLEVTGQWSAADANAVQCEHLTVTID